MELQRREEVEAGGKEEDDAAELVAFLTLVGIAIEAAGLLNQFSPLIALTTVTLAGAQAQSVSMYPSSRRRAARQGSPPTVCPGFNFRYSRAKGWLRLWVLIAGVNSRRWGEQAAAAGGARTET